MTSEVASVIFSHIVNGSPEIQEYSSNKNEIEECKKEKEEILKQKKEIQVLYEKTQQNIEEANEMIMGSIPNEIKQEEFEYFDTKTNEYQKEFHRIVEDHISESRKIEIEIIKKLDEAQQFEIETINKIKGQYY